MHIERERSQVSNGSAKPEGVSRTAHVFMQPFSTTRSGQRTNKDFYFALPGLTPRKRITVSVQCMHKLVGFWWGFFLTLDFQVPVPFPDLKEEVNNSANETTSTEFLEFAKMNYLRYSK